MLPLTIYLPDGTVFEDQTVAFGENVDGLFVKREQHIPDEHLASLRDERLHNASTPAGEMHRVASLPVTLVELWLRQGFDIHQMTARQIVAKLRSEDLDAFVTSNKV